MVGRVPGRRLGKRWRLVAAAMLGYLGNASADAVLSLDSGDSHGACVDPVAAFARSELAVCRMFFEPLYVVGADGVATPHLAAGPIAWSNDRKIAVITLQANVELHDGRELLPQDVADSLQRAKQAGRLDVLGIKADVAHRAVAITLAAPRPYLEEELSAPWLAIAVRGVGSGPFVRAPLDAKRDADTGGAATVAVTVVGQRFASYWRGRAGLPQVTLLAPTSAVQEARLFHRGALWWSHAGADVASGLPAAHASASVAPPLASDVSLIVRHRALDAARVGAAIDPVALGLALPFTRTLVPSAEGTAVLASTQLATSGAAVALYYDQHSARMRVLAGKLAWQLGQRGLAIALTPVRRTALAALGATAQDALVLIEALGCRPCRHDATSAADPMAMPLLWYGPTLTMREALGGLRFDGWGMPVWEQLFITPPPAMPAQGTPP